LKTSEEGYGYNELEIMKRQLVSLCAVLLFSTLSCAAFSPFLFYWSSYRSCCDDKDRIPRGRAARGLGLRRRKTTRVQRTRESTREEHEERVHGKKLYEPTDTRPLQSGDRRLHSYRGIDCWRQRRDSRYFELRHAALLRRERR